MRVESMEVKITIPIPIGKPDCNEVIYTEEAIKNALTNLQTNLLILYKENTETETKVIGTTIDKPYTVIWDYDNQVCKVSIDGVIFYGGCGIIVNEITEDGKISDFKITSIGLTV